MNTDINAVLFPVELREIFVEKKHFPQITLTQETLYRPVLNYKAVTDLDNDYVFSVVSKKYRLITNQEALDLAEECFKQVFKVTQTQDMMVFNITMPKTRSFCHIDLVHREGYERAKIEEDAWFPYLRVTNSYNRTFALNFDIGFCRWICSNGVIFGKKNIQFKYYHNHKKTCPWVEFSLKARELDLLEKQFTESLVNLSRYYVKKSYMWPLACKVFGLSSTMGSDHKQQEIFKNRKQKIDFLSNKYFEKMGENGYAALSVLSDFASRPIGYISTENVIDSLQKRTGSWINDFIAAMENRSFNFEEYLGEYAKMVG